MEISRTRIGKIVRTGWDNQRRRTRKVLFALPFILLTAGIGLCIFSGIRITQIRDSQKSQIAAELWSGDTGKSYRQITCFAKGQTQTDGKPDLYLTSAVSLNSADIEAIHKSLDTVVKAASGEKEKSGAESKITAQTDTKRLWIDAYSSEATCTVVRTATDLKPEVSSEITLTGVSGDYYLFHPLKMIGGAFLSDDTLDPKKIVIDKELAFKLFGFYDVVGSDVKINDRAYTIVGVVQHGDTKIDKQTTGALMHAYVLFDELSCLSAGSSVPGTTGISVSKDAVPGTPADPVVPADPSTLAIMCYEVVLPNKISGIAMQNLKSAMETAGKVEKNFLFVDNTDRFSLLRLYDAVFPIGENILERQQYRFPFWELSAETAESVSVFWWILGFTGFAAVLSSGLAIYAGIHKRKESGV